MSAMARKLTIKPITIGRLNEKGHAVFNGEEQVIKFKDGQLGAWGRDSLANARGAAQQLIDEDEEFAGFEIEVAL